MANSKSTEPEMNAAPVPAPVSTPTAVPALFRKIDWLAMVLTFAVVWTVYFLTLAPELTLEDSGELVTGSVYAGIPHPPGYPVWAMYSWLWTVLVPVGNYAWRVALGQATSGAFACGLLAFLVSRGSSLLMESIEELRSMTGRWENAICLVCGLAAGILVGLDGFVWRESVVVNRIAVFSLPWLMLLLVCLLRWLYAPHQMRYAYAALFLFGVCITIHQSLIVAAMAVEITIALGNRRMGRNAFFMNFVVYAAYMGFYLFTGKHLMANMERGGLFFIFNVVGIGSLAAAIWLATKTEGIFKDWLPVFTMGALWALGVSFYFYMPISCMTNPPMQWGYPRTVDGFFHAISRGQYDQPSPTNILKEPGRFGNQMWMMISGVADEFTWVYMLIAIIPFIFLFKMQKRERSWMVALGSMYFCLGVLLTILLNPTPDRASADLIRVFMTSSHAVVACLIGYGLAIIASYMATHYQKFRLWGIAGGIVATVVALFDLYETTENAFFGRGGHMPVGEWGKWLAQAFAKDQFGLSVYAGLLMVGIAALFVFALVVYRQRSPLLITLGLFALTPLHSGLDHWFDSEQRNHWFGYWFGHDMFTPPFADAKGKSLYPEMTRNAVLFGGTDPGRFCPEYMIYCESFLPHECQPKFDQKYDRRDVYIITQNALADPTYLCFIRAHYNRSEQKDPPFFRELARLALKDNEYQTNLLARMVTPLDNVFTAHGAQVERRRRTYTSYFEGSQFTDMAGLASRLRSQQDPVSKFVFENLSEETRKLITNKGEEAALRNALARDLNQLLVNELETRERIEAKQLEKDVVDNEIIQRGESAGLKRDQERLAAELVKLPKPSPLYTPERFKQVAISDYLQDFIKENPKSHTRIRLNRLLLEAAYPTEIARSIGGVYPDREIHTPSPAEHSTCYQGYYDDAGKRAMHDMQFPNEPRQIKQGEDVRLDPATHQISVSGTVAVMGINGLLTKVIFDANPKNEFFVEESFPLDWMYPHLTPFGVIMKINREPLPTLTQDILDRDHSFWMQYANRFTGPILDYNTSVKDLTDWIEKTYLRHDFSGFKGDRKFVRDEDAKKAFSKLRSSIGGIYYWRIGPNCPPAYRPKNAAEYQAIVKETEFALRQAFAFCPFSPEAVFRYVTLLVDLRRVDDAILVTEACLKLDPFNPSVSGLREQLKQMKQQGMGQ
jgi:hypothetical protein